MIVVEGFIVGKADEGMGREIVFSGGRRATSQTLRRKCVKMYAGKALGDRFKWPR
jgi:hypothetical protein